KSRNSCCVARQRPWATGRMRTRNQVPDLRRVSGTVLTRSECLLSPVSGTCRSLTPEIALIPAKIRPSIWLPRRTDQEPVSRDELTRCLTPGGCQTPHDPRKWARSSTSGAFGARHPATCGSALAQRADHAVELRQHLGDF